MFIKIPYDIKPYYMLNYRNNYKKIHHTIHHKVAAEPLQGFPAHHCGKFWDVFVMSPFKIPSVQWNNFCNGFEKISEPSMSAVYFNLSTLSQG